MESSTVLARVEVPAVGLEDIEVGSLYAVLQQVTDRRKARGRRYEAAMLLVLILLAKMSGVKSMLGVADWVEYRAEWLRAVLPWKWPRFPCANTYTYLCNHVDGDEISEYIGKLFAHLYTPVLAATETTLPEGFGKEAAAQEEGPVLEHLALDGKSLRGSRRSGVVPQEAQFVVGLYNTTRGYMMRQIPIIGKGHERSAGLQLLSQVELQGKVVSADALHSQPKWCRRVLDQGGNYLIIAKANQSTLRSDIALLFSEEPRAWLPEEQASQTNKGHSRIEVRKLRVSSQLGEYLAPTWPGVQQVFQIERRIHRRGEPSTDWVYGMTSLPAAHLSPSQLLALVRQHWLIENRSHWRRDVTLGEDGCKVATGQAPHVLALLNNIILALLDYIGAPNAARQIRRFDALPDQALALLMHPL